MNTKLHRLILLILVAAFACARPPTKPICKSNENLYLCTVRFWAPGVIPGPDNCLVENSKYFCATSRVAVLGMVVTQLEAALKANPKLGQLNAAWDCLEEATGVANKPNAVDSAPRIQPLTADLGTDWTVAGTCGGDPLLGGARMADPAPMCDGVPDADPCQHCAGASCCAPWQACQGDLACQCWISCEASGFTAADCEIQPGNDPGVPSCGPQDFVTGQLDGCLLGSCAADCGTHAISLGIGGDDAESYLGRLGRP